MNSKMNMRRVNVLKSDTSGTYVQGKGYPMVTDYCGHFHAWGVELHEQEEGSTNFTIALVERDGLSKEEILDLRNCEWDGLEVTVICEASDGYYDVLLPNGRVINALSKVHLAAIMKDA